MGTCPEIKTNPLALIACEYGPIALGALGVETTSLVKPLIYFLQKISPLIFADTRRENKSESRTPTQHFLKHRGMEDMEDFSVPSFCVLRSCIQRILIWVELIGFDVRLVSNALL
jgi:hypothetical protein